MKRTLCLLMIIILSVVSLYGVYVSDYTGPEFDAMLLKLYGVTDGIGDGNKALVLDVNNAIKSGIDTLYVGYMIVTEELITPPGDRAAYNAIAQIDTNGVVSATDLFGWIATYSDSMLTIADDGDGTITLALPQEIDTNASVDFGGMTLVRGLTMGGDLKAVGYIAVGDTTTGDHDVTIYFADDAAYNAESFKWDDGDGEFILSDDLDLGANTLTVTGSIGATGSRVLKGWFTAAEITSAAGLTVGGSQINSDALSDVASIGMLDEAETVTGIWVFSDTTTAVTVGAGVAGIDYRVLFNGETADGSITYKEDEDRFDFDNDVDVIGDLTASTIASDGTIRSIGYIAVGDTASGDSDVIIYFADDAAFDAESLMWNDGDGEFQFTDDLDLGSNNLLLTGDIGATGSRITKGWFTAMEVTTAAALTVGGSQINSGALSDVASIGMLDEAESVLAAWVFNDTTTAITVGAGTAGIDYRILFNGETADGTITYMEDEDRFDFDNDVKAGGNISAIGYIAVGDTTTGDHDAIINFADDAVYNAESFKWDDGDSEFQLSDDLDIGANNLSITGSIGETGARLTKLWSAAVEITTAAALTIGGSQINSDALSDVASIGMLDEAESVLAAWVFNDTTTSVTIGAGVAGIDYRILFNGETNDGIITYLEDEDAFSFDNDMNIGGNIDAIGYIAVGDTTAGDHDAVLYFADDAAYNAESLTWNDGDDEFQLSDDLDLGANNLLSTGDIGATGSRITKGWFTGLEVTTAAALAIGGAQINSSALSDVSSIGMLDEAETVTGAWILTNTTTSLTIGAGAAGIDYRILFNGETADGIITYKEDEDQFVFDNDVDIIADLTAATITSDGSIQGGAITGNAEANFTNNAAAVTFGKSGTDADVVLSFDAVSNQGSLTYMEDEDRFDFDNDVDVIGDFTAATIASDGTLSGTTLNTGQGAYELYAMNQDLESTDNVIFANITADTVSVDSIIVAGGGTYGDDVTVSTMVQAEHLKSTDDIEVADDILLSDGSAVGITGNELLTFAAAGTANFTGCTVDVDGAFTASSVAADGAVSGTTITGSDKISTISTSEQFKLGYDATNYMSVLLLDDGHTTFTTVDPDGAEADINFAPDGNVGIKTVDPTVELDVTGSIKASGTVSAANYGSDGSISDAELLTLDNGATTEILVGGGAGSTPVWTTATGTGAPVRAGSPTFTTQITTPSVISDKYVLDPTPTPATADSCSGFRATMGFGDTIAQWDALYMGTDGELYRADADTTTSMPIVALAVEAGTDGQSKEIINIGYVWNSDWNWTVGGTNGTIYASETLGGLTQTKPAGNNDVVQVIGYAVSADCIFFNPDYTTIVLTVP